MAFFDLGRVAGELFFEILNFFLNSFDLLLVRVAIGLQDSQLLLQV